MYPHPLGGWSSVANVFIYDPDTDTWTSRTPMPTPRGGAHAVEVGGKICVIGGYTSSAQPTGNIGMDMGSTEEYDPTTDSWTIKQPMPTLRNHHAIGTIGGKSSNQSDACPGAEDPHTTATLITARH